MMRSGFRVQERWPLAATLAVFTVAALILLDDAYPDDVPDWTIWAGALIAVFVALLYVARRRRA